MLSEVVNLTPRTASPRDTMPRHIVKASPGSLSGSGPLSAFRPARIGAAQSVEETRSGCRSENKRVFSSKLGGESQL